MPANPTHNSRNVNYDFGRNSPTSVAHIFSAASRTDRGELFGPLEACERSFMSGKAKEVTRRGRDTYVEYVRFADDLVILVDRHPRHEWLLRAVGRRLREELAKLQVGVNEEKSRVVDLAKGESFGFLGFDFRRVRSLRGRWRPHYTPKVRKRTALLRKLKNVFRRFQSQPVSRAVPHINTVLRGWVNYFAIG